MTKEEAIRIISGEVLGTTEQTHEAVAMAVEALSAQSQQVTGKLDSDCISRQAAIDAIHCDITVTGRQNAELVAATIGAFADRIKALPSAQPEQRWIPCSERLPESYECVLCYYGKNDYGLNFIDEDGEWYIDGVVSWMPIPKQ